MNTHRRDAGFSLAAVIFFASAASIFIAAAVPAYQMQAKREVEEELIFRGEEYARAIQKYQRKFGVYPTSVDQLVQTNGLRFVRRAYKDPMTEKEFRVITINPDGSVNGSKLFSPNANNRSLMGNGTIPTFQTAQPQTPGGSQTPQTPQTPQNPYSFTSPGQPQTPGRPQTPQTSPFSAAVQPQTPFSSSAAPGAGQPQANRPQTPTGAIGLTGGNQPVSGGIIGVASNSDKDSIKVYNTRQKYDEWEFVAILGQRGQTNPAAGQPQNPQNPQEIGRASCRERV